MPVLAAGVNPNAPAFKANEAAMLEKISVFRALEAAVIAQDIAARPKFAKRGQLTPRQRLSHLLDRGASFLELSSLAGLGMHDDDAKRSIMGGGGIAGIGLVSGVRVMVVANDSAIKGGTVAPMGLRKTLRAQEIARINKLPLIYLVESGGANLLYQSEIFVEGGRSFANQARLSAMGVPQIAVVHGSATAGGAYLPGLSDYIVLVRDRSKIFLAGPPLVEAAIGEHVLEEQLGGATLHAQTTGLGEYIVDDDRAALALVRDLVHNLGLPTSPTAEHPKPAYNPEHLLGIVPSDDRTPFDIRAIIAHLTDDAAFLEYKAEFGADTVCGHAAIDGHRIGIIANNAPIQPQGSMKTAQFIQACDQVGLPLLFLQNTTGYMVGSAAEHAGAIKHGSKMIQAVANASVPKLTIVIGGSFGAGNYGMCGRGFDPHFIFSWPTARTAVMGGAQAATVMKIISRAKLERAGATINEQALSQMADGIKQRLDAESSVLFGTARLWDDGIIDPRDTRTILGFCLATIAEAAQRVLRPNSFGVQRF
jgi:geranyl-CoA carboxylase beta subunit